MWLSQSITRLIRHGHKLKDISGYTLAQFMMFLNAATQVDAMERGSFVVDLSVVVGSLFSKKNPAGEHLELLNESAAGIKSDGNPE